jgi:acyl-homoserine-lactone acylase
MRTKARNFDEFKKTMELRTNASNNTVYADAAGNIAYWHGNFIPVRDKKFDWSRPVDGTDPATEWKGLHTVNETVHIYNPANGWIQNCNSTPFTVSGANSPKKENYPPYMAPDGENFRAINAVRVLSREQHFTLDKVITAGYDNYLSAFEELIPALISAYDKKAPSWDSTYRELAEPIELLRKWDFYSGINSVATSLAIEWGQRLLPKIAAGEDEYEYVDQVVHTKKFIQTAKAQDLLEALLVSIHHLEKVFGNWRVAWGEINRYQRISDALDEKFDDHLPSYPVERASSTWGCLPSFVSRYLPGTTKRYGLDGNSFICAVEFGKKLKAKSLLTGGESGHRGNKHFDDQAEMYADGKFKEVLFYKEDIIKHTERTYHPGE